MLTITQIKEELGPEPEIVQKKYGFIAYKNGEVFYIDTEAQAKNFKLYEKILKNQEEVDLNFKLIKQYDAQVFDRWYSLLQEEYSDISHGVFNVIYGKAYDDGHHAGYDLVAEKFDVLYNFYKECLQAKLLG